LSILDTISQELNDDVTDVRFLTHGEYVTQKIRNEEWNGVRGIPANHKHGSSKQITGRGQCGERDNHH